MTPQIEQDWYMRTFDALYPVVYAHRTLEAAQPEAAFAAEVLDLKESDRLLDLCCGNGRHLMHLLDHTPHVLGLDFSATLLSHARKNIAGRAHLVRGDMRALPFVAAFDVVTNFFTSFGYFQTPGENQAVLDSLAAALVSGGRFFIDYLNPAFVEAHLVPHSNRFDDGYEIREERWIDPVEHRVNKVTTILTPEDQEVQTTESVRLYTREEMEGMLRQSGLELAKLYGDYSGHEYSERRPRMIIVGRKSGDHA